MKSLFDHVPGDNGYAPAQTHSGTSVAAADSVKSTLSHLEQVVMDFLDGTGDHGATDEEMQLGLNMNPSTQRPRRIALMTRTRVVDSGNRRQTLSGRQAVVWVAVGGQSVRKGN